MSASAGLVTGGIVLLALGLLALGLLAVAIVLLGAAEHHEERLERDRRHDASRRPLRLALLLSLPLTLLPALGTTLDYPLVYVRAPRAGDTVASRLPDVFCPLCVEPGSDLVLRRPDGQDEVLVAAGAGAVLDPQPSLDASAVYYSYCPDVRPLASAREVQRHASAWKQGCDLHVIEVASRVVTRLTWQAWTPTGGVAPWSRTHLTADPAGTTYLGYGIYNTGPCPLPAGQVLFTSSRRGRLPPKGYTWPNFELYVLDPQCHDAQGHPCVEPLGSLNLGSALHPTLLRDGRVMFSSYESQGLRDKRLWALWAVWPDGRGWEPLMSAFRGASALHFQTQRSNGDIAVVEYYLLNNAGFGKVLGFPLFDNMLAVPRWGSPVPTHPSNPLVGEAGGTTQYAFSPVGLQAITPFSNADDRASPVVDGAYVGKVTHPAAAPGNGLLLVYSGGPVHTGGAGEHTPFPDAGIYVLTGLTAPTPAALEVVVNSPLYNEQQPKALVPFAAIYGVAPVTLPWLPNDGTLHPGLPAGTPYGLIGTSSLFKRNTAPGTPTSNWVRQGADAGPYADADIAGIRLLVQEPTAHLSYGPGSHAASAPHWTQNALPPGAADRVNERLRILGEIPVRKVDGRGQPLLDVDGHPDTSFLAKVPADVPFTVQTLDAEGRVLNMAQTWHQVRPGEVRTNCGGCHAHAQVGTSFSSTVAGQPGFVPTDLTRQPPLDVEYGRDVQPLLEQKAPALAALPVGDLVAQHTKAFQSRLSALPGLVPGAMPAELLTLHRWIDLATPVSLHPTYGWFAREIPPTLTLRVQRPPLVSCPIGCVAAVGGGATLQVGMASVYLDVTGADMHVTVDGTDITAQLADRGDAVWEYPLSGTGSATVTATVCPRTGSCARPRVQKTQHVQW